jgi:hypothetical protein
VTVRALLDTKLGVLMVMEYVEAKTLTDWIQGNSPFPAGEIRTCTWIKNKLVGTTHCDKEELHAEHLEVNGSYSVLENALVALFVAGFFNQN